MCVCLFLSVVVGACACSVRSADRGAIRALPSWATLAAEYVLNLLMRSLLVFLITFFLRDYVVLVRMLSLILIIVPPRQMCCARGPVCNQQHTYRLPLEALCR